MPPKKRSSSYSKAAKDKPEEEIKADQTRRRDWPFTAFVPADAPTLSTPIQPSNQVLFMAWQYETCPTSHRLHIQGYVYFTNAKRFDVVKKLVHTWCGVYAHFVVPRGTPQQNAVYCSKEESRVPGTLPFTFGVLPLQGTPSFLDYLLLRALLTLRPFGG